MCLAVPGQIVDLDGEEIFRRGRVSFGGLLREVSLSCVPEAVIGDYVLVHAGFAIGVVDEVEARRVFDHLCAIGELPTPAGEEWQ